ncbi:MAG: prolyl oligopeptidase family serine peptidase [bacterium]|nr:prolyl oligopeptidase family serine peptidase [bacterium]
MPRKIEGLTFISAVLAPCPATDMRKLYYQWVNMGKDVLAKTIENAYGGTPEMMPHEYRKRSAIYHVKKFHSIPVAIIHGDADMLIPVEHSRTFVKRASKFGIKPLYCEIKDGDHDSPVRDFKIIEKTLLWLISKWQ